MTVVKWLIGIALVVVTFVVSVVWSGYTGPKGE